VIPILPAAPWRNPEDFRRKSWIIKGCDGTEPDLIDVLLYFHCEDAAREVPLEAGSDFRLVSIEYKGDVGNYVTLEV